LRLNPQSSVRAVLFDAAGTLIRLAEPVGETYARLARPFHVDLEPTRVGEAFLRTFRSMPAMVFAGESAERIEELERAWWRKLVAETIVAVTNQSAWEGFDDYFEVLFRYFAGADAWRVVPGACDLLMELRRRHVRTAVVSNFDHRLHGLLEGLQLRPFLDAVVLSSDAGAAKPEARIFQLALQRLGVSSEEALFVGDDPEEDLAGARAAGLTAVDVGSLDRLEDLLALV
jgi:putative hydrolase of the HAD superfamily